MLNLALVLLSATIASLCMGCDRQEVNASTTVCEAARRQCEKAPIACVDGRTYQILECGCGCVEASLPTGGGLKDENTSLLAKVNGPKGSQSTISEDLSGKQKPVEDAQSMGLPPSDRVFNLDVDGDGDDELLGAHGARVWMYHFRESKLTTLDIPADGVLQAVAVGQWQGRRAIFLGFGRGRGRLDVPIEVFTSHDGLGNWKPVYREQSSRSDISLLKYSSGERDGPGEGLLIGFYASKYQVKTVLVNASRTTEVHGPQRMAGNIVYWKHTNQPRSLKVVGRIYGDSKGEPGDLSLYEENGVIRKLPISGGVRAVITAQTRAGSRTLRVGWLVSFLRQEAGSLKEVRREQDSFIISKIGGSEGEFTFFELWSRDLDGDGIDEIIARGNKHLTQFSRTEEGWRAKRLESFKGVLNVPIKGFRGAASVGDCRASFGRNDDYVQVDSGGVSVKVVLLNR